MGEPTYAAAAAAALDGRDPSADARQLDNAAVLLAAVAGGAGWSEAMRAGAAGLRLLIRTRAQLEVLQARHNRLRDAFDQGMTAVVAVDPDDEAAVGQAAYRALQAMEEATRG